MKVYAVVTVDYDWFVIEEMFLKKPSAEKRMAELKADPNYLWKKLLDIREYEVNEE